MGKMNAVFLLHLEMLRMRAREQRIEVWIKCVNVLLITKTFNCFYNKGFKINRNVLYFNIFLHFADRASQYIYLTI
jgi:hypothetical protein